MKQKWLSESNILTDQSIDTWRDCVRIGGRLLIESDCVESNYIDSMIETVEKFGPYMIIVPQICLFHGQMKEGVKKTGLSLVVLKDEIVFTDFDNQLIKCAFVFSAMDGESHLEMLKYLSGLLVDEKLLTLLRNNGSKKEILSLINELGEKNEAY